MSSERVLEIDAVMQRHIDAGKLQGAVTAVARHGKVVHFKAYGLMDVERSAGPCRRTRSFAWLPRPSPCSAWRR